MNLRFLLAACCLMWAAAVDARSLSLTFDDGIDPAQFPEAKVWNSQLIGTLQETGVRAMIFPTLRNVGSSAGREMITTWSEAGFGVGNHTEKHQSLSSDQVNLAEFIAGVETAEQAFHGLPTWEPRLRFPYLKEGDTSAKRNGMRACMKDHGYTTAAVSIDTSDWYYNQVSLDLSRLGDRARLARLQQQYVAHLLDRADYYDRLAVEVLHRSPKHVLLLHTNAINAATLGTVISAFRRHGWHFVSPEEAFADPLYATPPDTLPAGESIVWASAKAAGIGNLRYPGEDSVYEEPHLRALDLLPPGGGH